MRDSDTPGRRDTDVLASEVHTFVVVTQHRLHHIFLGALISMSLIAICTAAALFAFGAVVRSGDHQAQRAEAIAKRADSRSARSIVAVELAREKVCSQSSNRTVACRALFERLYVALSEEQRSRLACQVINHLQGPVAKALRDENPQCKEA